MTKKTLVFAGLLLFVLVGGLIPFISAEDYDVGGGFGIKIVVGDPEWVDESNASADVPSAGAEGNDDNDDSSSGGSRRASVTPVVSGSDDEDDGEGVQTGIISLNSKTVGVDSEALGVSESKNFILFAVIINVIELLALVLLLVVQAKKKNKLSKDSS
jgi:hypothetical protein